MNIINEESSALQKIKRKCKLFVNSLKFSKRRKSKLCSFFLINTLFMYEEGYLFNLIQLFKIVGFIYKLLCLKSIFSLFTLLG